MLLLFLNIITYLIMLIVNIFSNVLPLNGQTTNEISNKLDVVITPAGYVFSIWSLIYVLLAIWLVRQFPASRRNLDMYRHSSFLFILSNLFNSAWLFLWHYEQFFASVIVMLLLLVSLIAIYKVIKNNKHTWLDILPFSIYLGWVSVATIVNISYYLTYIDWDGFGISDTLWTLFMLVLAASLSLLFRYVENDWFYPLVTIWSLIGIGIKTLGGRSIIAYAAWALAIVILVALPLLRKKKRTVWY
ncbi:MAG: TspO/MBR family protein [Bacillus sp. (in: firmicutes)]